MRLSICIAVLAVSLIPMPLIAAESLPRVEPLRNGFYVSSVDLDGRIVKQYTVDSIARLCYASNELIPCKNLRLRDEWKHVITWISE